MRILAILLNILLICIGLYTLILENSGVTVTTKLLVEYFILFAAPTASIAALFFSSNDCGKWIGLYFKRKALEEQKKIDELSSP